MSAEPALFAQCASRAEELARSLRKDQAELDPQGAELVSTVAASLERLAAMAQTPAPGKSESTEQEHSL
jgi:hypothetical protein